MSGYWQRPEATAAALKDGWLHTGDLVSVDSAGRVRILDRRTDLINRGGENVYSIEVERVLSRHQGVAEVAVVGVPDPMMGSKVGAVVVPAPGRPWSRWTSSASPARNLRTSRSRSTCWFAPRRCRAIRAARSTRRRSGRGQAGGRHCGDTRTEHPVGAAARAGGPLGRPAGPGAGRGDRRGAAGRACRPRDVPPPPPGHDGLRRGQVRVPRRQRPGFRFRAGPVDRPGAADMGAAAVVPGRPGPGAGGRRGPRDRSRRPACCWPGRTG